MHAYVNIQILQTRLVCCWQNTYSDICMSINKQNAQFNTNIYIYSINTYNKYNNLQKQSKYNRITENNIIKIPKYNRV